MSLSRSFAMLALGGLLGCAASGERAVLEPHSGPSSGYYRVHLELTEVDPANVLDVHFGGIRAIDLRPDGTGLSVMVQGYPVAGPVEVEIETAAGKHVLPASFTYLPARDPVFARIASLGASLSQGTQNGVPTAHGQRMSPTAQVARQLGGYLPLAIFVDPFLPELRPEDIGPPPECVIPDLNTLVDRGAEALFEVIRRGFEHGRQDPDIEVHNVAVGGSKISHVLHGRSPDDLGGNIVPRLVYSPYEPVTQTQLEVVEELAPTLILSADLIGNDALAPFVSGDGINVDEATPVDALERDLSEVLRRLSATGAEVFVANMPRPSVLPVAQEKKVAMIEDAIALAKTDARDEELAAAQASEDADQAIAESNRITAQYNNLLDSIAAEYANVYVVDIAARVEEVVFEGVPAGDQVLTVDKFGGLLSLDAIHFTDTGYAFFANLFVEHINAALGTDVPAIDLGAMVLDDAGSPRALKAAGLDPSLCN